MGRGGGEGKGGGGVEGEEVLFKIGLLKVGGSKGE